MAVTYDATGVGGDAGTTDLTFPHTVGSGSNRILIASCTVGVNSQGLGATWTRPVTYGGVSMTSAGLVNSNNSQGGWVELFYLFNPAPGTANVAMTPSKAGYGGGYVVTGGSVSYAGVGGIGTPVTAFGNSTTPLVTVPSAINNMVLASFCAGNALSAPTDTQRFLDNINTGTGANNTLIQDQPGAASAVLGATITGGDWWGAIGVNLIAAAAAADTTKFFALLA